MNAALKVCICSVVVTSFIITLPLHAANGRQGAGNIDAAAVPQILALPKTLPTSSVRDVGPAADVRVAVEALETSIQKPCRKCKGRGRTQVGWTKGQIRTPVLGKCKECHGTGNVPNDPDKVADACLTVATQIVKMKPQDKGAEVVLKKAHAAVTDCIIKKGECYAAVLSGSAGVLSQAKPAVNKTVMAKCVYGYDMAHPTLPDKKVHVFRIADKKRLVAIVSAKQEDMPPAGGLALVAGVIAGSVEVDLGNQVTDTLIIIERRFILTP